MGFGIPPTSSSSSGEKSSGKPSFSSGSSRPASSDSAAATPAASSGTDSKKTAHKPARFLTVRERLPKGLPDWFEEKDANGDGQITMAEFTSHWTPEKVAEFARYDLNHDGIITAAECLKVEAKKSTSK